MLSSALKVVLMLNKVLTGPIIIMITMVMGTMEIVLPDMYMMKTFMGACLMGPKAKSQDLLAFKVASLCLEASACNAFMDVEYPGGHGKSCGLVLLFLE